MYASYIAELGGPGTLEVLSGAKRGDPEVLVPLLFLADPESTSFPRSPSEPGRSVKKQPTKSTPQRNQATLDATTAAEASLVKRDPAHFKSAILLLHRNGPQEHAFYGRVKTFCHNTTFTDTQVVFFLAGHSKLRQDCLPCPSI